MGRGANRNIKAAGLPALNDILAAPVPGVTRLDFADPFMGARMRAARVAYWEGEAKGLKSEIDVLETVAKMYSAPYHHPDAKRLQLLKSDLAEANAALVESQNTVPTLDDVRPHLDWPAVRVLADWSCDGVLISVDDDVDIDDQPHVSRDDGVLLNVAIQGPTPCRNTAWQAANLREDHEYAVQHIDASIAPLDKVFVGIFWEAERDAAERLQRVGFRYKMFSGRQLAVSGLGARGGRRTDAIRNGPSDNEFEALCGAWRVGSVMDNRLTTDVERMLQLNVCVEFWTLPMLRNAFIYEARVADPVDYSTMASISYTVPPSKA